MGKDEVMAAVMKSSTFGSSSSLHATETDCNRKVFDVDFHDTATQNSYSYSKEFTAAMKFLFSVRQS